MFPKICWRIVSFLPPEITLFVLISIIFESFWVKLSLLISLLRLNFSISTDLSLSSSGSFLTADVENNKEVPINYQLSGYTSGSITIEDSNGPLETVPLASILSGSQTPPLPGVAPDEEKEKIVVQEKINKDVFDDVSRIISFISVDGASNAALIQNEFITSFPQVDAISIQRL